MARDYLFDRTSTCIQLANEQKRTAVAANQEQRLLAQLVVFSWLIPRAELLYEHRRCQRRKFPESVSKNSGLHPPIQKIVLPSRLLIFNT